MRTLLLILLAAPAAAQEPMTAGAFDAFTHGRTLNYSVDGVTYGAERHGPGRRVVWSRLDGTCAEGVWFPRADQICFLYETGVVGERCWTFARTPAGMEGRLASDPEDPRLYRMKRTDRVLDCPGAPPIS